MQPGGNSTAANSRDVLVTCCNEITLLLVSQRLLPVNTTGLSSLASRLEQRGFILVYPFSAPLLAGRVEEALGLLQRLKERRRGKRLGVRLYTTYIWGLCQEGRMDEAEGFLEEMREHGVQPNERTLNVLLQVTPLTQSPP